MDDELMISQDLKINCQVQPNFTFLIFIFVKPIWDHEKRPICPFTSENRFLQLLIERMIIKITAEICVHIIWGHKEGQVESDADFFLFKQLTISLVWRIYNLGIFAISNSYFRF